MASFLTDIRAAAAGSLFFNSVFFPSGAGWSAGFAESDVVNSVSDVICAFFSAFAMAFLRLLFMVRRSVLRSGCALWSLSFCIWLCGVVRLLVVGDVILDFVLWLIFSLLAVLKVKIMGRSQN